MKIGFFDSGIGGLSVLHHGMKKLTNEQFIFYADSKHVPYGEKTEEEVIRYVDEAAAFLIEQGVGAIVLACNTATSVAGERLRSEYDIPIIGMEPAAKKALDLYGDKRVLVVATEITVRGEKMQHLIGEIDENHLIDLRPLQKLVRFAESENFATDEVEDYLRGELGDYDWSEYSSIVLGCTHFNYFKDTLRKILPEHVHLVDGNDGTINQLQRKLEERNLLGESVVQNTLSVDTGCDCLLSQRVEFYQSGVLVDDEKELARIHRMLDRLDQMYEIG